MDLREAILGADDLEMRVVEVPEWGVEVGVRELTAQERDGWEASILDRSDPDNPEVSLENIRAKLLVRVLVDPATRERVFADGDLDKLAGKSGTVAGRLFRVAQDLNGLSDQDIEELAGN